MLLERKLDMYYNCETWNKLNLQNLDTLPESVKRFWELETLGTCLTPDLTRLLKNEWKAVKVLADAVEKMTDNYFSVCLL